MRPRTNRTPTRPIGRADFARQVENVQQTLTLGGLLLEAADDCEDPRVADWFRRLAKGDEPEKPSRGRRPAGAK